MRTQILKPSIIAAVGLLLTVPAAYFLLINVFSDLGWSTLYNASEPLLINLGLREGMGLNINLLIAFGPLIAFLLNATSVIAIDWQPGVTDYKVTFQILKRWTNWTIIFLAGPCLLILFLYLIRENCH